MIVFLSESDGMIDMVVETRNCHSTLPLLHHSSPGIVSPGAGGSDSDQLQCVTAPSGGSWVGGFGTKTLCLFSNVAGGRSDEHTFLSPRNCHV